MSSILKTFIVSVFIFSAFALIFFFRGVFAQSGALVTPDVPASVSQGNQKGKEILALLDNMKKIRLGGSIFSSPVFQSLKDLSVELIEEPKGRPNPFAPIGKDAILSESQGFATTGPRVFLGNEE